MTKNIFKYLVIALAVFTLLQYVFGSLFYNVPLIVEEAWKDEYYSTSPSLRILFLGIFYSVPCFIAIGAIAMCFFKKWGRILFIVSIITQMFGAFIVSWTYRTAFSSLWGSLMLVVEGMIIAYAFSGEIADEFSKKS